MFYISLVISKQIRMLEMNKEFTKLQEKENIFNSLSTFITPSLK